MKKKWLVGLTAVSMLSFVWGCGNSAPASSDSSPAAAQGGEKSSVIDGGAGKGATEFNYWTFVELHGQLFQTMLKKWNAANPDRQIKLNVTVMPYDDMHNKLSIAVQTGTGAPDIADIEVGKFPDFLKGTPQLEPLNDVIDKYRDTLVKSRVDLYSKDGKNYGIDYHVGATVAFYNTEILQKAGIDYKNIVTWDDYKKAGEEVYKKTGKYMGTADTAGSNQVAIMLAQQKTDTVDASGKPILDSDALVKGLTILKDMQKANVIHTIAGGHPDTEEAYGEYNKGNYASALMPLWFMSRYVNYMPDLAGKIAIAPLPVIEKGMPRSVGIGGTGTVVTKTAKDVKLAKDFLAFAKLSEDANIEIWNTLGFDPVNMKVWDMKEVTHNKDNKFVKYFVNNPFDVLNTMKSEIQLKASVAASPTINNILCTVTLNEIFEKNKDIKTALQEAQKQVLQEMK